MATLKTFIDQMNRFQASYEKLYNSIKPMIRMTEQAQKLHNTANLSYLRAIDDHVKLLNKFSSYSIDFLSTEVSANTSEIVKSISLEAVNEIEKLSIEKDISESKNEIYSVSEKTNNLTWSDLIAIITILVNIVLHFAPIPTSSSQNIENHIEKIIIIEANEFERIELTQKEDP